MKKFAEILKTLGEINRLRILKLLQRRPAYVCEIAAVLELSMATVSSHLSVLKRLGIVKDRKEGVKTKYFLVEPEEAELKELISLLKRTGEGWEIVKKDREKLSKVKLEVVCPKHIKNR